MQVMKKSAKYLSLGACGAIALVLGSCAALFSRHPVGNDAVQSRRGPSSCSATLAAGTELARYEQGFQRDCDGVTADYALRSDGKISVINRCRKPDGSLKQAKGVAKLADSATNAKLKVSFFGPFYGDYWVLDHADDYSWSIVGEPSGRTYGCSPGRRRRARTSLTP